MCVCVCVGGGGGECGGNVCRLHVDLDLIGPCSAKQRPLVAISPYLLKWA